MLLRILAFELRYQLRQPLFWISLFLFFLLTFGAISTDVIVVGGAIGSVNRNAPFVILQMLAVMTGIGTFLTTAFVANSIHRDFESRTDAVFFSLPLKKRDYLLGRFSGSLLLANLVFLGVIMGIVIGSMMPWLEPARVGPFLLGPYVQAMLIFVVPNLFLTGAIFFSCAALTRSLLWTYVSVVVFFVGWGIAGAFLNDLENKSVAAMADPFGLSAFELVTRYWTVSERNAGGLPFTGALLWNRILWVGLAALILAFTCARFKLTTAEGGRARRRRRVEETVEAAAPEARAAARAPVSVAFGPAAWFRQYLHQARLETIGAITGTPFLVMLVFGVINIVANSTEIDDLYGTAVYPVTHLILQVIQGAFGLFVFLILIFYSGDMVWRDRTLRLSEVVDALPAPGWVLWGAKGTALAAMVVALHAAAMATGIGIQMYRGYTNFEVGLYLKGLFLVSCPQFLFIAALCLFVQVAVNQKFLGWLISLLVYVMGQVLPAMRLEHHLYRFATAPEAPYSDMNGFGHFVEPRVWFFLYWGFVCAVLVVLAHLLWVRGTGTGLALRLRIARRRLSPAARAILLASLAGVAATGGWIYYNTNVLNDYLPAKTRMDRQAEFEKLYKANEKLRGPRVINVAADVDIHPETRSVEIRGRYLLVNKTTEPIQAVHVTINPLVTINKLEVEGGRLDMEDARLGYRIFALVSPLAPGAQTRLSFDLAVTNRGFVNNGANTKLVANGTFFDSYDYFPHLGYSRANELDDPNERRRRGLPPVQRFPKIDDAAARMDNYISSEADWVHFETTVSTSPDQIAIAPGYLQKEWEAGGRRYFHYAMDSPIFDFFAYLSARYAVTKDVWNDVAIEVYHHPGHPWNVNRMIEGVKASLDYFTRNFGPYQHRQVRIVEFPRYARFAQSFPNTIPFSESIGFIARLDDEPEAIDYVFYVTAHEVAHQWWAHQVMGGNVQGATLLSETMSQYSALMVMEKAYGRDKMRKFLKYEMDNYLRGRGGERIEEMPLYLVENQPYIHYRKGSVVMYALRDYVGEEPLNRSLAEYVSAVKFQQPPYTFTLEFLDYIRSAVPEDRLSVVDDMFRNITLYENRASAATWSRRDDGKYVVTLSVSSAKFRADGSGAEMPAPLDDWVDVGVFGDKEPGAPPEGRLLYLEKRRIQRNEDTFEVVVDQKPFKAGIDPFNKLIDRNPENNLIAVSAGAS
ncbi:MAG TPA: M1 family aminopeptidase [Candidatus Polarisedimenticolia bacterium]|jgi:ABC-type transport system involved in multi-copper enzyme maturation permease subunit